MSERTFQVEMRVKLKAWRDTRGFIENLESPDLYYDGMVLEPDDRVVHVTLRVPESLWQYPHIDVDVRSAIQEMLSDIRGQASEQDIPRP